MEYRKVSLIIFSLTLAALALAAPSRVSMVLETSGTCTAKIDGRTVHLRTLQVLPNDLDISVGPKSKLRLTYFQSGKKEVITGPCQFRTGLAQSQSPEGAGGIVSETSAGAKTLVPKDENLRRMGGAVHAMVDQNPELHTVDNKSPADMVAMVSNTIVPDNAPVPYPEPSPTPRDSSVQPERPINRVRATRIRPIGLSPVIRKPQGPLRLSWSPGKPPYTATLRRQDGVIETVTSGYGKTSLEVSDLKEGEIYTLDIQDSGTSDFDKVDFYVLTSQEEADIRGDLRLIERDNQLDRRAQLVHKIAYFETRDLLAVALPLAEEAVARYPDDVGLVLALGRIQWKLGDWDAAEKSLVRAEELDVRSPK